MHAERRWLGDAEGQNLVVERYSVEGRPETDVDLAREVVNRNPDVIFAVTDHILPPGRTRLVANPASIGSPPIQTIGVAPFAAWIARALVVQFQLRPDPLAH
jgi:hypothetical protein